MKKFVFIILSLGLVVYLTGCGKKQQPLSETQEPISIEELGKLSTSNQAAPEMAVKTAPTVTVTPSSAAPFEARGTDMNAPDAKLEQLPPSGPYKPTTKQIQIALKNAGFYTGMADGKKGPLTNKAIDDFQKANDLPVDGKVGPKTWAVLGKYLNPEPDTTAAPKKR